MAQTKNDLIQPITLAEYAASCLAGKEPPKPLQAFADRSAFAQDVARFAVLVGASEPLAATRPGACDMVGIVDRTFTVPPAISATEPSTVKALSICSSLSQSVVIDRLRLTPANLTAEEFGLVQFKRVLLATFGEFCLPFTPEDEPATFINVEHVILCPKSGFDIFAVNTDPFSEAVFHIFFRGWATC